MRGGRGGAGTLGRMEYQLASERVTRLKSDIEQLGRLGPRRMLSVPDGICHAMPVGGAVAACGRSGLTLWARPWSLGPVERCSRCLELAPITPADPDPDPDPDPQPAGEAAP